jgi:hypothetical protein
MAITAEDLRAPKGLLELAMWPGLAEAAVDAILDEYIALGTAEAVAAAVDAADVDAVVRAYAYYRAFRARSIQLASMPSSVSIPNEESISRSTDQRQTFEALADQWEDAFNTLIEPDDPGTGSIVPPSGHSLNEYRGW